MKSARDLINEIFDMFYEPECAADPNKVCLFRASDKEHIKERGVRYTFCGDTVYALKVQYPFQLERSDVYEAGGYVLYDPADDRIFALKASSFETYVKDHA